MRTLVAGSTMMLLVACVKAPHEAPLAYEEFDKAPDYVWRAYANAPAEDEARAAYWAGYQQWLCPGAVDADGAWHREGSATVQRTVACDGFRRERRRSAETDRDATFAAGAAEVELGMTADEVRGLLGRPASIEQSDDATDTDARWIYRDASRRRTVLELRFREGRLESLAP